MAGFAELERNLISERTALSLAHKRQQHQVFNHPPFGFKVVDKALVENSAEVAIVNLIRERREDGWSLQMIATALNEDDLPAKLGGHWYARTVKNILDSDLYDIADATRT